MAVLLMLMALIAPGLAQNAYYTPCPCSSPTPSPSPCPSPSPSPPSCPNSCGNPTETCNTPYNLHTQWVTVVPNTEEYADLDNVCHTFFCVPAVPSSYQAYFSKTYKDGTVRVTSYVTSANDTSDVDFASHPCAFNDRMIATLGDTQIVSRRINNGDCVFCDGTPSVIYPLLGLSDCPGPLSDDDIDSINEVFGSDCGCPSYRTLEYNLPSKCVETQCSTSTGNSATCPAPCYETDYPPSSYPSPSYPSPSYPSPSYPPSPAYYPTS